MTVGVALAVAVLVEVDVDPGRFFNLSDLGDFASAVDADRVEVAVADGIRVAVNETGADAFLRHGPTFTR